MYWSIDQWRHSIGGWSGGVGDRGGRCGSSGKPPPSHENVSGLLYWLCLFVWATIGTYLLQSLSFAVVDSLFGVAVWLGFGFMKAVILQFSRATKGQQAFLTALILIFFFQQAAADDLGGATEEGSEESTSSFASAAASSLCGAILQTGRSALSNIGNRSCSSSCTQDCCSHRQPSSSRGQRTRSPSPVENRKKVRYTVDTFNTFYGKLIHVTLGAPGILAHAMGMLV